ncbi:MAG: stage III sporulation protein AB [Lachnospiraceae bacterium]|nr:stage III sporulation protein AB [Lachnospiraceae bacterium]MDE7436387.1 stage III sporulation protein AB [Lachnospiraceae bacterium]
MVRLLGAVLILAGAAGMGWDYCNRLRGHYQQLLLWKEYIWCIEYEMVQRRRPLPEIAALLKERQEPPFEAFFADMEAELQKYENSSPRIIWQELAEKYRKDFHWSGEEARIFADCGSLVGQTGRDMVPEAAKQLMEQIDFCIGKEQRELAGKLKVSAYLCAAGGVFLVLVLI